MQELIPRSPAGGPVEIRSFGAWRDTMQEIFPGFDPQRRGRGAFQGEVYHYNTGALDLTDMTADGCTVVHDRLHQRAAARPGCCLLLQLSGDALIAQGGAEVQLAPGDLTLVDGTRPVRFSFSERYRHLALRLARPGVAARLGGRIPVGRLLKGEDAVPDIMRGMMLSLARGAGTLPPDQTRKLLGSLVDVLGVALADSEMVDVETQAETRLTIIQRYIETHLSDPALTPQRIARANAVSKRQLYRLFEPQGYTPARWLLERRLERCREALLSQQFARQSIGDIALAHGFTSFSHFSRSYKQRFGITPREDRHELRPLLDL